MRGRAGRVLWFEGLALALFTCPRPDSLEQVWAHLQWDMEVARRRPAGDGAVAHAPLALLDLLT